MGILFTDDEIRNFEQIYVIACGSASYIGVNAQYVFEDDIQVGLYSDLTINLSELLN